jgi:hypothetical protein
MFLDNHHNPSGRLRGVGGLMALPPEHCQIATLLESKMGTAQ